MGFKVQTPDKKITQYGPWLWHLVCYLNMWHQNTTLLYWLLDGARIITNQYLTISWMSNQTCTHLSYVIATWQTHSGFLHFDTPECDVWLNLLGLKGDTSKRFVHIATYKSTTLPSHELCYKSRESHCQTGQPMHQSNNCTGWDIYDLPKASTYYALAWVSNYTDV